MENVLFYVNSLVHRNVYTTLFQEKCVENARSLGYIISKQNKKKASAPS